MLIYTLFTFFIILLLLVASFLYLQLGHYIEGLIFFTLPGFIIYNHVNYYPQYYLEFN